MAPSSRQRWGQEPAATRGCGVTGHGAHGAAQRGCLAPSREEHMKEWPIHNPASPLHLLKEGNNRCRHGRKGKNSHRHRNRHFMTACASAAFLFATFLCSSFVRMSGAKSVPHKCVRPSITTTLYMAKMQLSPIRSYSRWHRQIATTWQIRKKSDKRLV